MIDCGESAAGRLAGDIRLRAHAATAWLYRVNAQMPKASSPTSARPAAGAGATARAETRTVTRTQA